MVCPCEITVKALWEVVVRIEIKFICKVASPTVVRITDTYSHKKFYSNVFNHTMHALACMPRVKR